ncbi:3385_t:CDS:2 [Ambispora gerdemannii]|uniref:UDP-N-acetylglucosamine--dolichyl-phosphate N-acetylglucosaminephosphotransferase n=1 Tax=Ambispora gerdemannii TaxID=144530 RepID=A0A9N8ZJE4_9GLOM|nr:3385_t:CDS:2 [Ambispora gerdemannii]
MLSTTASLTVTSVAALALVIIFNTVHDPLLAALGFALLGCMITLRLIPALKDSFKKAGRQNELTYNQITITTNLMSRPESMGVVCATVYLVCLFLFIPFPFMEWLTGSGGILSRKEVFHIPTFPHDKLGEFLSAILSLQSMIFLGFADDVFDIRWRYKLLLPTIASIPLLMVYYVNFGVTYIVVPIPLRFLFGRIVDLGVFYYLYMSMMAVFCTNSINILAGINGVEAGQSLVIGISIAINDWLFLNGADPAVEAHLLSLFLILPFIGVTIGLLFYNWYPSKVFVGDTYCYFAGMTFAVVGILGHFSKTMLLFFIPQIFNFLYSAPQLFKLMDCPRHRMPKLNAKTRKLEYSRARIKSSSLLSLLILKIFSGLRLAKITKIKRKEKIQQQDSELTFTETEKFNNEDDDDTDSNMIEVNNFTLINLILLKFGPMHEHTLTITVMIIQILGSALAFFVRYRLVHFFYKEDGS